MKKRYKFKIRLPQNLIFRLQGIIPRERYGAAITSFKFHKPTTFRANTKKIKGFELRNQLMDLGFKIDTVAWYKDAFILRNRNVRDLRKTSLYKEGFLYVQSLSSMIPSLVLQPQKKDKILDICAAPGGKSLQISNLSEDRSEILAVDSNPIRLEIMKRNIRLQGPENIYVMHKRAEKLEERFDGFFDKVLSDVPCSGEGRICALDKDSYIGWSMRKVRYFSELQKNILHSAYKKTKKGGTIVYSTCTLSPEENEEVVDWLLEKEKGNIRVLPIRLKNISFSSPVMSWEGKTYNRQIKNTVRIIPGKVMEGFYIAKLQKDEYK